MKRILHIENLDCPVCAEALEGDLSKIKGVNSVVVDYVTQTITLDIESEESLSKVVKKTNKFEEVRVLDGGMYEAKGKNHRKEWLQIGVSAALFLLGALFSLVFLFPAAKILSYIAYGGAYVAVGYPVLLSTAKNIAKGRLFDENFLMTVASVGAMALGEVMEGVAVIFLYQLGELLQSIAVGSSRRSVAELMQLKSERAILVEDGQRREVSPETLKVGDIALVKAGEKTPADGELLTEQALIDTKSLTGEAGLKKIERGQEVLSGAINAGNAYEIKVLRPYEDSAVGRILDMVENAAAGKAVPEKFIAKFAKVYTPVVCGLALAIALLAPLFNGLTALGKFSFYDVPRWVRTALAFLVISCPCALVISVPLTYFSGLGACAKKGILVKGATYLDTVAQAKTVAFDKTGTLTEGVFTVRKVTPVKAGGEKELLQIVAAVEKHSAHPVAKAFEGVETSLLAEEVDEIAGKGMTAKIGGEKVVVGSDRFLREGGFSLDEYDGAYTLVCVAKGGAYLGCVEIGDAAKKEAKESIRALQNLGIERIVMLTGDGEKRARSVANEVGASEVNAELLPDGKLLAAEKLKKTGKLLYIGDGVNDAPVMMAADCALSMGKLGSAAAIEASDMVLISDDLRSVPQAVAIAKKTRKIALQNIIFSIAMKVGFMALGVAGVLPLWLAVFADVGVMLLAVCNSFRVRKNK